MAFTSLHTLKSIIQNRNISFWWFTIIVSVFYFCVSIVPEICRLPVSGICDIAIMCAYFAIIFILQLAVIFLITVNKYVFSLIFPILLTATAILSYFYITLNVTFTVTVVDLCINNDFSTSSDFITLPVIFTGFASLLIGIGLTVLRSHVKSPQRKYAIITLVACLAIIFITYKINRVRDMIVERMPFIIENSIKGYIIQKKDISEERHTFDLVEAKATNDSLTVVLVIGEALRSDHLSINGYERSTTPLLAQEQNLVSFPNISTDAYYTMISIPRLLTRADDENIDEFYDEQSFIPLFRKAGYHTSWISNQETLGSFAYIMEESDTVAYARVGHSLYMYDKWLDEDLLPQFQKELSRSDTRKLIILHTIGSHWWFPTHYTEEFAKYKPEISSRNISQITREEMVNSYDNTVLYTDWFLSTIISHLRNRNAILLFQSDHGEGLGDDGNYLHAALNYGTQKPAAFVYWSDSYMSHYPDVIEALKKNHSKKENTGYLFHTILDCANIQTPAIEPARSLAR